MKRLIFSSAFKRNKALDKLEENSDQIRDHIIKCVVYHDIKDEYIDHWIDELSSWFSAASEIKSKSKLKRQDYENSVFASVGDELIDCKVILKSFRNKYCSENLSDPYPEFVITSKLISGLFNKLNSIKSEVIPLLQEKDPIPSYTFKSILSDILL